MKIIVAPDSFKGSLTSPQACAAITRGVRRVMPDAKIIAIPLADGGEGTAAALAAAAGGVMRKLTVTSPLGLPVDAEYGVLGKTAKQTHLAKTAVIEIAQAAGLTLVPPGRRNPLHTTTYGIGQLILDALRQGSRDFIIGLGGSATNDCGCGMAAALGVGFFDRQGGKITTPLTGQTLGSVDRLDLSGLHPAVAESSFLVACDVDNPLLGPKGASRIYAPQKGAKPAAVELLETNMAHIINLIEGQTERCVRDTPGAGAAGGLGAGLLAFLNARLARGIDIVMEYSQFAKRIEGAELIITGEGRIDGSTAYGKTIYGVSRAAAKYDIPVIALAGSLGAEAEIEQVRQMGVKIIMPICSGAITIEAAMSNAANLLADRAEKALKMWLKNPEKAG